MNDCIVYIYMMCIVGEGVIQGVIVLGCIAIILLRKQEGFTSGEQCLLIGIMPCSVFAVFTVKK